ATGIDELDRRGRLSGAVTVVHHALRRRLEPQQAELADAVAAPPRREGALVEHADVDRRDRPRGPVLPRPHRFGPGKAGGRPTGVVGGGGRRVHFCILPCSSSPRKRGPSRSGALRAIFSFAGFPLSREGRNEQESVPLSPVAAWASPASLPGKAHGRYRMFRKVMAALAGWALTACASVGTAQDDPGPIAVYGNKQTFEIAPVLLAAEHYYPGEATVRMGSLSNLVGAPPVPGFGEEGEADVATNAETQLLRYSVENPNLRVILGVSEGLYRVVARKSAGISSVAD